MVPTVPTVPPLSHTQSQTPEQKSWHDIFNLVIDDSQVWWTLDDVIDVIASRGLTDKKGTIITETQGHRRRIREALKREAARGHLYTRVYSNGTAYSRFTNLADVLLKLLKDQMKHQECPECQMKHQEAEEPQHPGEDDSPGSSVSSDRLSDIVVKRDMDGSPHNHGSLKKRDRATFVEGTYGRGNSAEKRPRVEGVPSITHS